MIRSSEEFEAALEEAIALLESDQTRKSQESLSRLDMLLAEMNAYHPQLDLPPDHPQRAKLAALGKHLDRFDSERHRNEPEAGSLLKGRGDFLFPG